MPSELLLAPVGAGKTEYALSQLHDIVATQPFAPIWVLLPGRRQEDAFRQRLVERSSGRVFFNVTFFSFYTLYARLLDMVGLPQRELDETARLRLIRGLLTELQEQNQLTVFHKIADKPGFAKVIGDFIYELKQNVIFPEAFEAEAIHGTDKDRDLATIYLGYQSMLRRNNLIDREGEGWLALEQIKQRDAIAQNVAMLLVDGFDQFNPLQLQLMALLASRVQQTTITLPHVPGRENTLGRRFTEARQRIVKTFEQAGEALAVYELPISSNLARHDALNHIIQYSFIQSAQPITSGDGLKLIEAPDPKTEVSAVMRQVKRLLLEGTSPDEILIPVRDWASYAPHFENAVRRYGIPAVLHYGDGLTNNPAVIALLNLLELARFDFRRRDVLDVLRSPYFAVPGIDDETINRLDVISREQQVIRGRRDWLEGIQAAVVTTNDEDGEQRQNMLPNEAAEPLQNTLQRFFEGVTPPETGDINTYIGWIEGLIGNDTTAEPDEEASEDDTPTYSLGMLEKIRASTEDFAARDLVAIQKVKTVLRGMLATQKLFAVLQLEQAENTNWQTFINDFKAALSTATLANNTNRSGKVLITSVTDARGLPHEHVFIPGLSEGIFPRPVPEDPIYLDSERQALTDAGIYLETQAERAADEGLFYELISLPRKSLTLSRPTIQNGAIWPESHLWRAIKILFGDSNAILERHRIALGGVVKAEDAAHRSEAVLAVADGFNQPEADGATSALYNWLLTEHQAHWQHVCSVREIEHQRMTSRKLDHYSGRLQDARLLDWVVNELDDKHIWSASQFNDYGMCGFRFFAKRLLKLEEMEEPEDGMDAAQRGTVIHAILEETYRQLAQRGVSITPEHVGLAIEILRDVANQVLPDAPRQYGFRASVLWTQEQATLMRKVEALVRADFSDESPLGKAFKGEVRVPYMQEVPLGGADGQPLLIRLGGSVVKVVGYIDRIDRIGDRAIVLDYKTGSTKIPTSEMREGRNFQMMLYLLAGEAVLAREVEADPSAPTSIAGGTFWHLNRSTSGVMDLNKAEDQEALDEAQLQLGNHLQQGRAGNFASIANRKGGGACSHYCEFTQFCRVSSMNRRKQ